MATLEKNFLDKEEIRITFLNILKDMIKYFPSKLFGLIGNAIVIPIYTNLLSTEQYGIYILAIAFLSFLCILFSDWIGLSGLRFFKQHEIKKDIPKYLSTLIGLLIINLFVMLIFSLACSHWFYDYFKIPYKIIYFVVVLIIPVAVRAMLFQILRAQIKPLSYTISTILNQIMTIAISICLIKAFHWGAYAMLTGMAVSITITDFILLYQSNIKEYFVFKKPKLHILLELFKYGIPLAITSISLWVINQSNRFVLNKIHGFGDVGYLGVAYGLTFSILSTIFVVITVAAYPRIINLYEENFDVRPIISKLTGYFIMITLPIVTVYALYSEQIVSFMANAKFHNAYVLIPYLSFSVFFFSLAEYTTLQYLLSKKTYLNTIIRLISAAIGFALNVYLIQKMGLVGLGIATLIGNFIYFVLSILVTVPGLNWQVPFRTFSKITLAYAISAIAYFTIFIKCKHSVFNIILIFCIYYFSYYIINRISHKFEKI